MKKCFIMLMIGLITLILASISCYSQDAPEVEVRFTEIIIKVKPDTIIMPEGAYRAPLDEIEIKSEGLKELNKKFNLVSMVRMFAMKESQQEEALEESDLENVFLLKFPDLVDLDEIISEYKKIEEVIYAEENKVLSIY